ncbi:MAG: TetR/AcrR family bet gene transcriptional repressor [Lysobacterales bacterium]|jgi:TetR/AcrR family transcriptional repressor of bet genes
MSTALAKPIAKPRTASKKARQQQLIKATIRSIAKNGLSTTTIATVSKEAKLSQGIINLHFQSKDKLLVETLRYIADEYKTVWEKALEESGDSTAEKISALVGVDFEKSVCQRNKLAVWFAFWGETKSRPIYREICRKRDKEYLQVMIAYCRKLIKEGGYKKLKAESIANALLAMTEGLWLDLLMSPDYMTPEECLGVCMHYLQTVFPEHFKA